MVALTANTISGAREMFRNEGFTEFIPKPIERSVLERVLRKVLPEENIQYGMEVRPDKVRESAAVQVADEPVRPAREAASKVSVQEKTGNQESLEVPERKGQSEKKQAQKELRRKKSERRESIQEKAVKKEPVREKAVHKETVQEKPEHRETVQKSAAQREPIQKKPERREPLQREAMQEKPAQREPLRREPEREETGPEEAGSTGISFLQLTPLVEAGMNVRLGLEYCCGEKEFYLEMLQTFAEQSEAKKAEIQNLFETGNWGDYAIKVHALKSTSLTIGAEQLSEKARALEQAGRNGNTDYILQNHSELMQIYDKVCSSIGKLE